MPRMLCPLLDAYQTFPKKKFLEGAVNFTYLELHLYSEQLLNLLNHHPKGSVFAISTEEPIFFSALLFACLRGGYILFPLSKYLPENEISRLLKESGALEHFNESIPFNPLPLSSITHKINLQLPLTYLLTSGSTSKPKIAVHSFENHLYSALGSNQHLQYNTQSKWLLSLPLYHVSGLSLIFRTVLAKASLVQKKETLDQSIENPQLTHISFVPTQLQRLITNLELKKFSCILLGGAPISSSLIQQCEDLKLLLYPTYGLTEMSSQVCTYHPSLKKMITLPYREIKLSKEGELLVRGKTLFMGYLKENKIEQPFNKEGYFATGDLASLDGHDFVFLGRKDNLFISGGENIQPEEIEQALLSHPDVLEALVLAKPDSEYGHRPYALIATKKTLQHEVLSDYLKTSLPKFKIPIGYAPLTYLGLKPSRKKLADEIFSKKNSSIVQ